MRRRINFRSGSTCRQSGGLFSRHVGRMRRPCLQIRPDGFLNKTHVAQLVIPEPPGLDVSRPQIRIAFLILGLLKRKSMLASVQFEVVPGFGTIEIKVVFAHFMLSAELVARESPVAENAP